MLITMDNATSEFLAMAIDADPATLEIRLLSMFSEVHDYEDQTFLDWITNTDFDTELDRRSEMDIKVKHVLDIGNALKQMAPLRARTPIPYYISPLAINNAVNANSTVSHSLSTHELQYIFTVLLPVNMDGKRVLEIGSRIGTAIYGAYFFTDASSIIGIEIHKDCFDVQNAIIRQFDLERNRINVIYADAVEKPDVITNSDVIIINVKDYSADNEDPRTLWHLLKKVLKKDTYIVTNMCLTVALNSLGILKDFSNWVKPCEQFQKENMQLIDFSADEDFDLLKLYVVN